MGVNSFLKLVEIQTKAASVMPFLLGTAYAVYRFKRFEAINFMLMLGALTAIDMFTTALNNYYDYKRSAKKEGYNYESHNAIVKYQLKEVSVIITLLILLIVASLLGILLSVNTNIVVFLIGVLSFLVGIGYSFGPLPISRTPLGEVLSGVFMGFVILFLSVYIHVYDQDVVTLKIEKFNLFFHLNMLEIIYIVLVSLVTVCGIANIMLANNICDIEDDIADRRYTLPVCIGKEKSLLIFKGLYYIAYLGIIALTVLRIIPLICLAALLTLLPVNKNIKRFYALQTKKDTFVLSVKNFFLMTVPLIVLLLGTCLL